MASLVLCSIPYTGTTFTCELFNRAGWEVISLNQRGGRDKVLYQGHMIKETQIGMALELARKMPIVIPLRHPFRCEQSWVRKGQDVGEMIKAYQTLIARFDPLHPYYMPVDSLRRDDFLDSLRAIDSNLETDWGVVHSQSGTYGLSIESITPSAEVIKLISDNRAFFARFYDV